MGQSTPFAFAGTVIGGAIGSIGGPGGIAMGAQIGGTVGTVAEAIFARPQDSAKTADAHWGGVTFGTAIPRGWANHQTDCFVFWGRRNKDGSYLFKHPVGKGKGKGKTDVEHYHATFAFHILETGFTFPDGRQVERAIVVDRIWMADKIVWQNKDATPLPAYDAGTTYYSGDFAVYGGKTYWSTGDGNEGHTPGAGGSKQWWAKVSASKNYPIHIHPDPEAGESAFTMPPSSVIASHDGVANTPAMRGSTYGVFDDGDTFDLGNTVPFGSTRCDWHFADPAYTLGQFLSDVCGMAGMPVGSYDFSDVTEPMPGYRQTSRQSGQDLVSQPLSVLGYDLGTIDGVVRAIKRGQPVTTALALSELGAVLEDQSMGEDEGDEGDLLTEEIPADRLSLHSSMKLGYYDAAAGYRQSFQTAIRNDHGRDNPTDLPTDLVLTGDQAARAVGRILDTEWLEAGAAFGCSVLGPRSSIAAGDAITVPYRGYDTRFRVVRTEFIQNLHKLSLMRDEASLLTRHERGAQTLAAVADDGQIKPTIFTVMSPKVDLSNDLARYAGFYVFANGPAGWLGGQVAFTFDPPTADSREWVSGPFVSDEATFGTALGALDSVGGSAAPASPTLSADGSNASASLSWTPSPGATSYTVRRGSSSGGPYTTLQSGLAGTTFVDSGLTNGTTYHYVVTATNAGGESPPSNDVAVTPATQTAAPAAPQSVVARGLTGRVGLEWSPSDGASSYTIRRGSASGSYPDTVASGVTASSYVDQPRTNGTTYHYAVFAVNSVGTSPATGDAYATPIAQVTGVTATGGDRQIAVSWGAAAGATGYQVICTPSGGSSVSKSVTGTSTTLSNLVNGTVYSVLVSGTNTPIGGGDASSAASATPSAPASGNPQVPRGGSASFAATASNAPSQGPGWQVLSPAGTSIAIDSAANGWSVTYSTTNAQLTVSAPSSATVATNYTAKYLNTSQNPPSPHSAPFDVVAGGGTVTPEDPGTVQAGS